MTQPSLNRFIATATGEAADTIERIGFSVADPLFPNYDPEGDYQSPASSYLDWDSPECQRSHSLAMR